MINILPKTGLYLILFVSLGISGCMTQHIKDSTLVANAHGDRLYVINEMLDKGANINYTGEDGASMTPLMVAVSHQDIESARLLLERGADPNIEPGKNRFSKRGYFKSGYTAMAVAVHHGDTEMVALLSRYDAKLDDSYVTKHGEPLLIFLIKNAQTNTAKIYLAQGGQVDVVDSSGNTPLHLSMYRKNDELTSLLLKQGADKTRRNNFGLTADEMATQPEIENRILKVATIFRKSPMMWTTSWPKEQQAEKMRQDKEKYAYLKYINSLPEHQFIRAFMIQFRSGCHYKNPGNRCYENYRSLLFMAVKLKMKALQQKMIEYLNEGSNVNLTNDFLKSGSATLRKAAREHVENRKDLEWRLLR